MKNCTEKGCALADGHEGLCHSMLDCYEARTLRAEVERLRRHYAESDAELTALTQRMLERDNEVERLRDDFQRVDDERIHQFGLAEQRMAEVERLRGLLSREVARHNPDGDNCDCKQCERFRAALAGHAPGLREDLDACSDEYLLANGADLLTGHAPGESRRALAERVREACARWLEIDYTHLNGHHLAALEAAKCVRALDLDAVLSESERPTGASTPRPRGGTP